ncbi:Oligopeptide ABC transporter, periplasmic oligopeptide-binding protein OppA (TC 3.A.1.5.1) [Microbacterium esteraromaticum]|uniref:Oligopeptide ABC transporter, periplasmic oligopeptide-binding protein OppA (TC 3.A.1.5.1) n=1 Tax=Microbacterium esteraromaticum TaxID=57043 RepID=A0A1R4KIX9_9MICO|nr:ABC transporter family substrate-binding protein [Microbacterium esteraromaticum]SJN44157.1 Oligopeptide ABC transporter, periplasmic oligopeptide-binding protein OppA (TC 3.A.1.5.1) [Microbacterium esteraromaticum]
MKQQKLMGALAISGTLALVLGGCASNTGDNGGDNGGDKKPTETKAADYNPQPRENLKEGGVANFGINEIPEQMNSFNADTSADSARLAAWYMPQILLMKPDGTPYKHDAYLDKWETDTVDGKTQITFTFTKEATWNDGTPMDWTAIDATWKANRSTDEGFVPNATDGYKEIESVKQGDTPKTAIVTFKGEFAWPQMPFLTGVIHPALADPDTFNKAMIDNPHPEWGAGPYTVDEFDANKDFISFKPNDKWWGDKPMLDKVTFQGMDAQASINAFKNGEIDQVGVGTKDRLAQVADMKDITIHRAQQTANTLLEVDATKPQFEDVKVRQAFFMAVDIDQQKKIAWNGLDYEEEPAGSLTLFSFQPGYSNSLEKAGFKYDADAAKKLLDEAGWTEGADGIREKDGEKLSVTYPIFSDDPTQKALAQSLQASEKAVGIDVKIDVRPSNKFAEDYTTKNWDIASLRFTSSDPFGAAWFCQLYCQDMGLNLSGVQTPEMDKRIKDEVESISDPVKQTEAAMKLEVEIFQDWGLIPLYNGPSLSATKKGLANLTPEPYVGLDLFAVQPVENTGWEK